MQAVWAKYSELEWTRAGFVAVDSQYLRVQHDNCVFTCRRQYSL